MGIPIEGLGDGFSWKSQDLERSGQIARDGLDLPAEVGGGGLEGRRQGGAFLH